MATELYRFSQVIGSPVPLTKQSGLGALHSSLQRAFDHPEVEHLAARGVQNGSPEAKTLVEDLPTQQRSQEEIIALKTCHNQLEVTYHFCTGEQATAYVTIGYDHDDDQTTITAQQWQNRTRFRPSPGGHRTRMLRRVGPIHRAGNCITSVEPIVERTSEAGSVGHAIFTHIYFLCCDGIYRNALRRVYSGRNRVLLKQTAAELEFEELDSHKLPYMMMSRKDKTPLPTYYFGDYPFVFSVWGGPESEDEVSESTEGIDTWYRRDIAIAMERYNRRTNMRLRVGPLVEGLQ